MNFKIYKNIQKGPLIESILEIECVTERFNENFKTFCLLWKFRKKCENNQKNAWSNFKLTKAEIKIFTNAKFEAMRIV